MIPQSTHPFFLWVGGIISALPHGLSPSQAPSLSLCLTIVCPLFFFLLASSFFDQNSCFLFFALDFTPLSALPHFQNSIRSLKYIVLLQSLMLLLCYFCPLATKKNLYIDFLLSAYSNSCIPLFHSFRTIHYLL